jgi:ribonuclease-3
MNTERFHNIEDIIGYTFCDLELLVTALTHKSYANERKINKVESYERSEFLGDAILEFVVSEYLYKNY